MNKYLLIILIIMAMVMGMLLPELIHSGKDKSEVKTDQVNGFLDMEIEELLDVVVVPVSGGLEKPILKRSAATEAEMFGNSLKICCVGLTGAYA